MEELSFSILIYTHAGLLGDGEPLFLILERLANRLWRDLKLFCTLRLLRIRVIAYPLAYLLPFEVRKIRCAWLALLLNFRKSRDLSFYGQGLLLLRQKERALIVHRSECR